MTRTPNPTVDQLRAEKSLIEDRLASPVLEGDEWNGRRAALYRRLREIENLLAGR